MSPGKAPIILYIRVVTTNLVELMITYSIHLFSSLLSLNWFKVMSSNSLFCLNNDSEAKDAQLTETCNTEVFDISA